MEEKKKRENDEKSNIDVQAKMWETDKKNWEEEERRLKSRINNINRDNQEYLLKQMAEKASIEKDNRGLMNAADFAMNRPLLREINSKLKTSNYTPSETSKAK